MSRLWSTLKSVIGAAGGKEVEAVLTPTAAVMTQTPPTPEVQGDGIFHNLSSVKPHVPLIKFRKGNVPSEIQTRTVEAVAASLVTPTVSLATATATGSLEWWQLPDKYRRQAIDDLECEAINMGATEKPFC